MAEASLSADGETVRETKSLWISLFLKPQYSSDDAEEDADELRESRGEHKLGLVVMALGCLRFLS